MSLLVLIVSVIASDQGAPTTCDILAQTQRQIDWWNSFEWKTPKEYSFGLRIWYRANALFTWNNANTVVSLPHFISDTDKSTITTCRIKDVRDLQCDADRCQMDVQTVYGNDKGATLSYRQTWTWVFDTRRCLVRHFFFVEDPEDAIRKSTLFAVLPTTEKHDEQQENAVGTDEL